MLVVMYYSFGTQAKLQSSLAQSIPHSIPDKYTTGRAGKSASTTLDSMEIQTKQVYGLMLLEGISIWFQLAASTH